jgi:hypothetical protein
VNQRNHYARRLCLRQIARLGEDDDTTGELGGIHSLVLKVAIPDQQGALIDDVALC